MEVHSKQKQGRACSQLGVAFYLGEQRLSDKAIQERRSGEVKVGGSHVGPWGKSVPGSGALYAWRVPGEKAIVTCLEGEWGQ